MSLSKVPKKRKIEEENRVFQEQWEINYFFVQGPRNKPVCLICKDTVACDKEYNIKRHYESKHENTPVNCKYPEVTYKCLAQQSRKDKLASLKLGYSNARKTFTKANDDSESATRASFRISQEIAKASKPFTDGELIKKCILIAVEEVCPDKKKLIEYISLSRNTVASRINKLSDNLDSQLEEIIKQFVYFSIAIDESTDVKSVANLAIFIRGVTADFKVYEELVALVALTDTTTGKDIFDALVKTLNKLHVDWSKLVSLSTDGAPAMVGTAKGVAALLKNKLKSEYSDNDELLSFHCIIHQEALCCKTLTMDHVMLYVFKTVNFVRQTGLNERQFRALLEDCGYDSGLPYHTDVRWLSRGTVLQRFFDLRKEIIIFMENKNKNVDKLLDDKWLQDLAFLVDITHHLNTLNVSLQGRDKLVTHLNDSINAFITKLDLFVRQLNETKLDHFPSLKSVLTGNDKEIKAQLDEYIQKLLVLKTDFDTRFSDFKNCKSDFELFNSPFTFTADNAPSDLQLELLELQADSMVKLSCTGLQAPSIYSYFDSYPNLKKFGAKIISIFGSTYVCEQLFSVMNVNKTSIRSNLTESSLNAIMKVHSAKDINPDIVSIVKSMKCQVSGSHSKTNSK